MVMRVGSFDAMLAAWLCTPTSSSRSTAGTSTARSVLKEFPLLRAALAQSARLSLGLALPYSATSAIPVGRGAGRRYASISARSYKYRLRRLQFLMPSTTNFEKEPAAEGTRTRWPQEDVCELMESPSAGRQLKLFGAE
ncbi:unnamed protein product [Prorocentrum cordatum]|uniref:Uncharacterized protein n=1 Tax=Prorocentrum cordatum TaxID=2364126 RepID=A0ABN9QRY1_9DINO|nr:unnamed protein product [Polarella glacialis]